MFERMPFGLRNAPAKFCKLMNKVFCDLRRVGIVQWYMDDIIIPAVDWSDMCSRLRQVLEKIIWTGLTLNTKKCVFGANKLNYLGFVVAVGKIRLDRKAEAICNYPTPSPVHEIRRFLGLTGYFRRFIQGYAMLSEPLTRLTRKDTVFIWGNEQQQVFDDLKTKLTSEPVLCLFNHKATVTQVHTDASSVGLAGMLLQGPYELDLRMVNCVSKKTTEAEAHYHSSRLELYAIVWTLRRLRLYLLGMEFTIITDCQALVYLMEYKGNKHQVARWFDEL